MSRRKIVCAKVRRMPEARPHASATGGAAYTHGLRMTFRVVGNGPSRPLSPSFEATKIYYCRDRLLHQMGRGRTTSDNHEASGGRIRVEKHRHPVWSAQGHHHGQRDAIRQYSVQGILHKLRDTVEVQLGCTPSNEWLGRGNQPSHSERSPEEDTRSPFGLGR